MLDDTTPPGQTTPELPSTPEVPSYQSKLSDFSPLSVAEQMALIAVQRGEAIWFSDDIDTSELDDNPLAVYEQLKVRRNFGSDKLFEFFISYKGKDEQTNISALKSALPWTASLSQREATLLDRVTHIDELEHYAAELRPTEKTTNNCLRAEFLRGLLLGLEGFPTVDPSGTQLYGAFITGTLNLNHAQGLPALNLHYCVIEEEVLARQAEIGELQLCGCEVNGISAQGVDIKGDLWLSHGFTSSKPIGFVASTIEGGLGLTGCQIDVANGSALGFSHSTISCGVQMNSAPYISTCISGDVCFNGSVITGNFDGNGANLNNCNLIFANAHLKGDLSLANSTQGVQLHGQLICHSATFEGDVDIAGNLKNPSDAVLYFDNANIVGDFQILRTSDEEFRSTPSVIAGGIRLYGAKILGHMFLSGCNIIGQARILPETEVTDFLSGLDFRKLTIKGGLSTGMDKNGAQYEFSVRGLVNISYSKIEGVVHLLGKFHGRYDKRDLSELKNYNIIPQTLTFEGTKFGSSVSFFPDIIIGACFFSDTTIPGSLNFFKGVYKPYILPKSEISEYVFPDETCLVFLGARIGRMLFITTDTEMSGLIFLAHTSVQQYANQHMDEGTDQASYLIDGFNYEHFGGMQQFDGKMILSWLNRQTHGARSGAEFLSQPYTQAAKVLKAMGLDSDAKKVLHERDKRQFWSKIARKVYAHIDAVGLGDTPENKLAKYLVVVAKSIVGYLFYVFYTLLYLLPWVVNKLTGHGYYPWRILYPTVLIWLFGIFVYYTAAEKGLFAPTAPEVFTAQQFKNPICDPQQGGNWINCKIPEYPAFSAIMYSTDTLLPVMNLSQQDKWQPMSGELSLETGAPYAVLPARVNQVLPAKISTWPNFLQHLVWFQTIAGWVISMILVAVFSGVLKKD